MSSYYNDLRNIAKQGGMGHLRANCKQTNGCKELGVYTCKQSAYKPFRKKQLRWEA
jgi:hypothetical protein